MDRMAAIEAFVKVSETKSFTEAAARLGQSKSLRLNPNWERACFTAPQGRLP